jgi:hypothetical protein
MALRGSGGWEAPETACRSESGQRGVEGDLTYTPGEYAQGAAGYGGADFGVLPTCLLQPLDVLAPGLPSLSQ